MTFAAGDRWIAQQHGRYLDPHNFTPITGLIGPPLGLGASHRPGAGTVRFFHCRGSRHLARTDRRLLPGGRDFFLRCRSKPSSPTTGRSPNGQRGFTEFGREHAKDNTQPDLKEFFQIGREGSESLPPKHLANANRGSFVRQSAGCIGNSSASALALLGASSEYLGLETDHLPRLAEGSDSIFARDSLSADRAKRRLGGARLSASGY